MSASYVIATLTQMADGLARIANFLEMFHQPAREAWLRDFREHGLVTDAEVELLAEYFGEEFAL